MNMDLDQPCFEAQSATSSSPQKRPRDDLDSTDTYHSQKRLRPFVTDFNHLPANPSAILTSSHPSDFQNNTITPADSPNDTVSFGFPTQNHLDRQRRELSPLSINTHMDVTEMQYELEVPQEAPLPQPAPRPSQAFGPPWGPDYGVNQISDITQDDTDNDMSNSNTNQVGTPAYTLFLTKGQINDSLPSARPRGAPEEYSKRLPSPISESEISPTTRVFQEHNETARWSNNVPIETLNANHQVSSLGGQGKVFGSQQVPNSRHFTLSMGYRADCEKCQRRVPGHYSHIVRY